MNCSAQAQGLTSAARAGLAAEAPESSDQKILTKRGRATYELKTNTLIITDTARKIQEIRELLARLDVPARQVMIEARVVVATDGWSRDLGARLGFQAINNVGRIGGDNYQIGGNTATVPATTPVSGLPAAGRARHCQMSSGAGNLALSLLNLANGNLLSLELRALEADNRGKVISNPRVMTSNQKPAVILNGTQIPYVTPGSGWCITANGHVQGCLPVPAGRSADSQQRFDHPDRRGPEGCGATFATGINVPAINTKRIKTQVRVNNGETLVLGGIFDGDESTTVNKVPLLGDVPVFGNLFKTTTKANSKTELIIFLTPRILDDRLSIR